MKKIIFALTFILISVSVFSQKKPKTEKVIIQTSAQCGDCKERIESKMNYTKGIVFAELDLETKKVTVKFKPAVISKQQIKETIAKIGYDADDLNAKVEDIQNLPKCCQPKGH